MMVRVALTLSLGLGLLAVAFATGPEPTTLTTTASPAIFLEKPVHFTGPDGSDLLVEPGTYLVEESGGLLRLTLSSGTLTLVIRSQPIAHEETLTSPVALSTPATEDEHHVIFMSPDGKGWEAFGSYTDVTTRGGGFIPGGGSMSGGGAYVPVLTALCSGDFNLTGDPVGGGKGYRQIFSPGQAQYVVRDANGLLNALNAVKFWRKTQPFIVYNPVIYIEDNAQIDLTAVHASDLEAVNNSSNGGLKDSCGVSYDPNRTYKGGAIGVPSGVTLASGRGRNNSLGGTLFSSAHVRRPLFQALGPNVRFTGLRVVGDDSGRGNERCTGEDCYIPPPPTGICTMQNGLVVDNSELMAWPHSAISLFGAHSYIHHNNIHHNERTGLGYGVELDEPSYALIEANVFDENRHAIGGSGDENQSYEARYNVSTPSATKHIFDMHGKNGDKEEQAGYEIRIHHNIFQITHEPAVGIRGIPKYGAWIHDNQFAHPCAFTSLSCVFPAVYQEKLKNKLWFPQKVFISNNCLNYMKTGWKVSIGGRTNWVFLSISGYDINDLRFGDFVGDAKTDVFVSSNGVWSVSESGRGNWQRINTSNFPIADLRFGDFVGDAKTDVFVSSNGVWSVSESGRGTWVPINSSGYAIADLRFGDFVGDAKTDVFVSSNGVWSVSESGRGNWQRINTSSVSLQALRFADLEGDEKTDVFRRY